MAFLITWTTYNSWLQGDPGGFRTHKARRYVPAPERYAQDKSDCYAPERYKNLYDYHQKTDAVKLSKEQGQEIMAVVVDTIQEFCPERSVICVGVTHVHILAELGGKVTAPRFYNYAKGRSARKLIAAGHRGKVWCKGYHVRYINDSEWESARDYVLKHKDSGDIVCELDSNAVPFTGTVE